MADSEPSPAGPPALSSAGLFLAVATVLLSFLIGGALAVRNTNRMGESASQVTHTHETILALEDILSLNKDAETGQRGFLLTGDERYLGPYNATTQEIEKRLDRIERLMQGNAELQSLVPGLRAAISAKSQELAQTIEVRRKEGFDAARAVVVSDRGRQFMDQIRAKIEAMEGIERQIRADRLEELAKAMQIATTTAIVTSVIGILLSLSVAYLLRKAMQTRAHQEWLQNGQIRLSKLLVGDQRYEQLGQGILRFFSDYLNVPVAALFVSDGSGYRKVATYGVPAANGVPERFELNDSLIGQAARDRRTFVVSNIPDGYLTLGSSMGRSKPRHLAIVPVMQEDKVNAILEFGFMEVPTSAMTELLERTGESISSAVRSVEYRENLQNLLEETQRQSEELQTQGEELRVSNEELEEQSRALHESHSRLETQQAELEQTNANLEEQTQLLELEKDQVNRAKVTLEAQAKELERASQYKSDFLANMSHELRTPLNSTLILAKLLSDNPNQNLTSEQVEYAETIYTAGNDLLTLINDILDLSKIEAGHMEIISEEILVPQLLEDLRRVFEPVANVKGLKFRVRLAAGAPETILSDRQRLQQVLKNLLSNAIKFTERGEVILSAHRVDDGRIAFTAEDTGIGIPVEQRQAIFEAFRQADGTTNRKYGGTGLGLSISRELTRLLGGEIHLESAPGKGSTFTATIPQHYDSALVEVGSPLPAPPPPAPRPTRPQPAAASPAVGRQIADDRVKVTSTSRAILVVEDDEAFANILIGLAHELDFLCIVTTTAEEAFNAAMEYLPSAVILDVGLPDHSGLWVLDRLKQERRTRHIPVHIISASDYSEHAYSLGAAGYLLKPVKRNDIAKSLAQVQARLSQKAGRVLIVEDDSVQQDSLIKLLRSQDVETVGVSTATECLEKLKSNTFDCMVLDLSLPDASGYSLLETLSNEDAYSFPPVIIYTGRQLSADEEQRLRKYSKSIIIKGAKSPERLLDEVTLFLHRVVSDLPPEQRRMLEVARIRDAAI